VNPCPCGFHGDRSNRCTCSAERVAAYRAKLSGPLLDRIDLQIALPPVDIEQLQGGGAGESSSAVRERVIAARERQVARHIDSRTTGRCNAELTAADIDRLPSPSEAGLKRLAWAVDRLKLSARAYGKVMRVARTIADLEGSDEVGQSHIAEAVHLRLLDRVSPSPDPAASGLESSA
jgi:magnesium chelatase family protein